MDDIKPVTDCAVKLEIEFKEEPESDSSNEVEESLENIIETDVSLFKSQLHESEEEEEIKPPLAVFILSNDGDVAGDPQEEESEKDCKVANPDLEEDMMVRDHGISSVGAHSFESETLIKEQKHLRLKETGNKIPTEERPYVCDMCEKGFKTKSNLLSHNKVHSEERPHVCGICQKSFKKKSNLLSHNIIHSEERPHKCDICHKCFKTKYKLLSHNKIHTGEKPYECDVCQRRFSHKHTLINHYKIHTGEKPYQCDLCNRGFIDKYYFLSHGKTHTGERPFECDICKKGFVRNCQLSAHKKIHSREAVPM